MISPSSPHQNVIGNDFPFGKNETIFGSTSRLYRHRTDIIDFSKECVRNTLKRTEIYEKIQNEQAAKDTIFALRDRCVRPYMHNPTSEELSEAFAALQVLWFLLPPIERHKGEKNKTFFLRTLHEVGRFRGVSMFPAEK